MNKTAFLRVGKGVNSASNSSFCSGIDGSDSLICALTTLSHPGLLAQM